MLRSRGPKARTANRDGEGESGSDCSSRGHDRQDDGSKVARALSGGGAGSGLHGNVGAVAEATARARA